MAKRPNLEGRMAIVRSTGGLGEVYSYWTAGLHSHLGCGIDTPWTVP